MNRREGAEIPERVRLAILLQYQHIRDGTVQQSVQNPCNIYGVSRKVPAEIYRKATQTGTLQTRRRSGRPSLMRNADRQASIVNEMQQAGSLEDN